MTFESASNASAHRTAGSVSPPPANEAHAAAAAGVELAVVPARDANDDQAAVQDVASSPAVHIDDHAHNDSPDSNNRQLEVKNAGSGKAQTALPAAYLNYLHTLRKAWTDLPDLTITYDKLAYQVTVPRVTTEVPNLWSAFLSGVQGLNVFRDKTAETEQFRPLHASSGVIRPGELTLILAPPGHGKSVLLKSLAGRMVREGSAVQGEVRWNGLTAAESAHAGQQLNKLTAYVDQGDVHFPMLTVRETFQFALDSSNADVTLLPGTDAAELKKQQDNKVELMLELLGLKESEHTKVGNAMTRGVSGGQKKRVTLGEMMIGQARALFLDEISTGLDSSATFDIVSALHRWTRLMNGSATVALLQPAPEVMALFDNVILMRHGQIVFSGTQAQLHAHLAAINVQPDEDIDFADWLVEFLTDPAAIWKRDMEKRIERKGRSSARKSFRESHGHSFREEKPLGGDVPNPNTTAVTNGIGLSLAPTNSFRDDAGLPNQAQKVGVAASAGSHLEQEVQRAGATHDPEPAVVVFHVGQEDDGASSARSPQSNGKSNGLSNGPAKKKTLGRVFRAEDMPPLSTPELRHAYEQSSVFKDLRVEISTRNDALKQQQNEASKTRTHFTTAQLYRAQSWSLWHHTKICLRRQWAFTARSPEFIIPRIFQSVFMGLIMGSLFYQLGVGVSDFSPRLGLILFTLIFTAFSNMSEVPLASEFKLVVYKQVDAGFYSTFSYLFSVVLMHFPIAIAEVASLTGILYWMTDFANDAGRFFFFLLLLLSMNLAVGAIFRTIAYVARNPDIALNLAGPMTAIFFLFGGLLITSEKIPNFLIWLYYLSPFSWGLRSGALNEFHSDRYADAVPGGGDTYLRVWQINTNSAYKWAGVGYLLGLFVLVVCLSALALARKRSWLTVGTRREHAEEGHAQDAFGSSASIAALDSLQLRRLADDVRIGMKTSSMVRDADAAQALEDSKDLAFQRMDITFTNLNYTVTVPDEERPGKTRDRMLLQNVNGFARAGELTALMGSSGAGKTTLMDVIAGRKTAGKVEGSIRVNGHPQSFPSFNRLMGYVEQTDIHVGMHTVREAIEFSAKLRLPSGVTDEARGHFVEHLLDELELRPLADRIIGDANVEGLSPGELKRLTIAVEMAANPALLFLDEPTSGLDSRAALVVLRVLRRISRRGRTVVCTIHQPSAELFSHFDRLLLLKSGGREVFFGDLGEDGLNVAEYFTSAKLEPGFEQPELPEKVNIASWMLDVIGAGTTAGKKIPAYEEVYRASELRKQNEVEWNRLSVPHEAAGGNKAQSQLTSIYAASYLTQFNEVLKRLFLIYWRDTSYNGTKFFLMAFLGVLFGLVYLQINDDDEPGMISKISVIYMTTGFMGVLQASNALPVIFRLREVFYRERASNTFAPWVYATTLAVVELPYLLICTVLYVTPLYFLVGFDNSAESFFQYLLVMYLDSMVFSYFGQLMASLLPNIQVANILSGLCFTFFFLFGGAVIQRGVMPVGWHWMWDLDFIPKSLVPLAIQQFKNNDGPSDVISTVQYGAVTKWQYTRLYLATDQPWQWYMLGWLVFTIVCVRILIALVVQKVSHQKR